MSDAADIRVLQEEMTTCVLCPRLVAYRSEISRAKRRAFQQEEYWGRPVPSMGEADAGLMIVGLAPAAHGGNRTGRVFTGDRSGDFLFRALYEAGFASQPQSIAKNDGLTLMDSYITAAVHCAPPGNKPLPSEFATCGRYLSRELELLTNLKVVVVLGKLAHDAYLNQLKAAGRIRRRSLYPFGHGAEYDLGPTTPKLLCTYHPSQQNTFTGRLTIAMLTEVFLRAARLIGAGSKV